MGKASKRKKAKKWELMERVVGSLERSIVPGATVEVDQKLPHLITGHLEQFDVVIRNGLPPRQTLTVVEVQKRSRKVAYNDFRGWCKKRESVGASHLLCVSEKGFPQSIIDEASLSGDTIRLLTLAELEGKNWPLQIVGNAIILMEVSHDITGLSAVHNGPPKTIEFKKNTPVLKRSGSATLLSGNDLAWEAVKAKTEHQIRPDGTYNIPFIYTPPPGEHLSMNCDGVLIPIKAVTIDLQIRVKRHSLPLTCLEYVQINYAGTLAYAMTAKGNVSGNQVNARMIFVPQANGMLRFEDHEIEGLPDKSRTRWNFYRPGHPSNDPK